MLPTKPDWSKIVGDLYRAYGTYSAILNKMAEMGVTPSDHAFLCYLRSGKRQKVCWEFGAALMNMHTKLRVSE